MIYQKQLIELENKNGHIKLKEIVLSKMRDGDFLVEALINECRQKKEITRLEKENQEMKQHIMAAPGGELFFEAFAHWNSNINLF